MLLSKHSFGKRNQSINTTQKTILQELYRLKNSTVVQKGLRATQAAAETKAAFKFAEENASKVIKNN